MRCKNSQVDRVPPIMVTSEKNIHNGRQDLPFYVLI